MTPTLADIQAARRRISARVRRTPLVRSEWLSALAGGEVYLKLESLQVTGSFKARGALNAVLALAGRPGPHGRPPRIVTASTGNHGRALAWAAGLAGIPAIVYTPRDAPAAKVDAIRRHGAELRADAATCEDAERMAQRWAADTGDHFLSGYSNADVLAGAGTVGLEIAEDAPEVAQVVVPVGGGGLVAGMAAALDIVSPRTRVVGVEVEASHPFAASLAAGRIVEVAVGPTLADGLAGNMDPLNLAFPIVQALVDRMTMVSEADLEAGIRGLVGHEHLIAEGAGIAGVAAVLARRVEAHGLHTVVVVSGANIDTARLVNVLEPGRDGSDGVVGRSW